MRNRYKTTVAIGILLLITVCANSAELLINSPQDIPLLIAGKSRITEAEAEELATRFGSETVSILMDILHDSNNTYTKRGMAAFCLGKCRAAEAVKPLVIFIENGLAGEMTQDHANGVRGALYGLGFIGNDEALSFLKQFVSLEYWLNKKDMPTLPHDKKDEKATMRLWRDRGLQAISASGNQKALALLAELKTSLEPETMARGVVNFEKEVQRRIRGEHLEYRKRFSIK